MDLLNANITALNALAGKISPKEGSKSDEKDVRENSCSARTPPQEGVQQKDENLGSTGSNSDKR